MDPDNLGMGAEAVVRKIVFKGSQAVSKVRIAKQYRHLILDQKLRSRRTASEARCLERAAKAGVAAPAVLQVDKKHECSIVMEFVPGQTLRAFLQLHSPAVMAAAGATEPESDTGDTDYEEGHPGDGRGGDVEGRDKGRGTGETETEHARSISIDVEVPDTRPASAARTPPAPAASPPPPSQGMAGRSQAGDCPPDAAPVEAFLAVLYQEIAWRVGRTLARLHDANLCHGDLTTSNMILRAATGELVGRALRHGKDGSVLVDFGLAFVSATPEDKAVDLYVLERALLATHPGARELFDGILAQYAAASARGKETLARLAKVRARGRKKSMIG